MEVNNNKTQSICLEAMNYSRINKTLNCRTGTSLLLAFLCSSMCLPLIAAEATAESIANFGITGSLTYFDNPLNLNDPQEEETLNTLRLNGSIARETQRFGSSFNYQAEKQDFDKNLQADTSRVTGRGEITWKAIRDRLQWSLSNNRSNQLIDSLAPDISDNRQVISTTSTGPRLTLPIGSSNQLNVQIDHALSGFEISDLFDQTRTTISTDISRNVTQRLRVTLQSSLSDASYDSGLLPGFEIFNNSVTGTVTDETYTFSLKLGHASSTREGLPKVSNPIIEANATYTLSSQISVAASYSETVQDLLSDLNSQQNLASNIILDDLQFSDRFGDSNSNPVFVRTSRRLSLTHTSTSNYRLNLQYFYSGRVSESNQNNQFDESISLNYVMPLSPKVTTTIRARQSELTRRTLNSDRFEFGVRTVYLLRNDMSVNFDIRHTDQTSNSLFDTYDGLNASIEISYRR